MHTLSILLICLAIAFAFSRCFLKYYIFSPLVTLSCAISAGLSAPWMAAALTVSAIGDWFLAHKGETDTRYLLGIVFFWLGHALFVVHAMLLASAPSVLLWVVIVLLLIGYSIYLLKHAVKGVPPMLKPAVFAYALISLVSFAGALATQNVLYSIGIGLLLFSDTMICEKDFAGNKHVGWLILPTYYACHILVALSIL